MLRRKLLAILSISVGFSGCLNWRDDLEAYVNNITLQNTSDDPVTLNVQISEDGSEVFSESISLTERGGDETNITIWEPVSGSGKYTIGISNEDREDSIVEIDTMEEVSNEQQHVMVVARRLSGGGFVTDVYTSESQHTSSTE